MDHVPESDIHDSIALIPMRSVAEANDIDIVGVGNRT